MSDTAEALDRTVRIARGLIGTSYPASDIQNGLMMTNVTLVADGKNLSSVSGQACLTTLFGLIATCGCNVKLLIPRGPIVGYQPPLRGEDLLDSLLCLGQDLIPGVTAGTCTKSAADDLVFVIGDTRWNGEAKAAWRVAGTPWSGRTEHPQADVDPWQTNFPIGALAAAAIASAEPFKHALRQLRGHGLGTNPLWSIQATATARLDFDHATTIEEIDLEAIDFVSGGAITNACLHALLRVPGLRAKARVIEPEFLELSNLNRYVLARRSDLGRPKAELIQQLTTERFALNALRHRAADDTMPGIRPLAPRVAIGVDNLPTRWLLQREWPAWLTVGATADFLAMSSEHLPGRGCAGCIHDRDDGIDAVIPTVSFVSYWSGLMLAVRILRQALGLPEWHSRKALMIYPLRMDSTSAVLWRPVPANPNCPVDCGRSGQS